MTAKNEQLVIAIHVEDAERLARVLSRYLVLADALSTAGAYVDAQDAITAKRWRDIMTKRIEGKKT